LQTIAATNILSNHTFIGCVDETFALIQSEQNIHLVNYNVASEELMYQIILHEFCNMGHLKLSAPISIRECLQIALDQNDLPGDLQPETEIIEVSVSILMLAVFRLALTLQTPLVYSKYVGLQSRHVDGVFLSGHLS